MGGSFRPNIDYETWEGWQPDDRFLESYASWPDRPVPQDIQVWCKGFIPLNASQEELFDHHVMPIKGPGDIPIPGLLGQCAGIDGRDWSSEPPSGPRPTDSRFWAWMQVANGHARGVMTGANCGLSHNYCCNLEGCFDGSAYGQETCAQHCPDSEMNVKKVACWMEGSPWSATGEPCQGAAGGEGAGSGAGGAGDVAAVKAYVQGRGGNPCGQVFGVSPPKASWDVGIAVFPRKRKVTLTGFVDDAPSYECYARAKDRGAWGPTVTLARVPMDLRYNIAFELAGNSDRPINPDGTFFDLPEALVSQAEVVV